MEEHIVGLVLHECLRHIPDTFVVAFLRAPRVLHHVVALAVLVFRHAKNLHAVVVCGLPRVERLLPHLLRDNHLRQRFLGQLLALIRFRQPEPVRHIRAREVGSLVGIGHHADTLPCEAHLRHIRAPSQRVALRQRIVDDTHHVLHRHIVHLVHAPVVGHFERELRVERMVGV